jgi:hypothetical protein
MQLSNRQVTGFVNGDGIMQDSNPHMLGGVCDSASGNKHTYWVNLCGASGNTLAYWVSWCMVYMGPRATHIYNAICIYSIDIRQATGFVNGVLKYCSVVDGIVKSA